MRAMKKKLMIFLVLIALMGAVGCFFVQGQINSLATTGSSENMEELIASGYVVQQKNDIFNLMTLEQFYKNIKNEVEDQIKVAIVQSNHKVDLYELTYANGQIKLYYDVTEDEQGRKEYKIRVYQSIKKILKQNQVVYKLVNEQEERSFLSYNLN